MKIILSFILLTVFVVSCNDMNKNAAHDIPQNIALDFSISKECAFLTKDENGNPVLAFVKMNSDSSYNLAYSISDDNGMSFHEIINIPGSNNVNPHNENLPKILFRNNGDIIAAWGESNPNPKNKYSGLVYISVSKNRGKTWSDPVKVTSDTSSMDQRYFDLALLPDGEAGIIWLDNRKNTEKEGSSLYFASTKNGNEFIDEKVIGETCCQCCRTDLFIDDNKQIHVAYRDIINDSIRDMVHSVSEDGGKTFTDAKRISEDNWILNGCPHTGPALTYSANMLVAAWHTGAEPSGLYCSNMNDGNTGFLVRDSVSINPTARHPQLATMKNGGYILVWDESNRDPVNPETCIKLQRRNSENKILETRIISEKGYNAAFPVIIPVKNNAVLVAWTQSRDKQDQVVYRKMVLK